MAGRPIALAQSIAALALIGLHAIEVHCADGAVHGLALARAAALIILRTGRVAMQGVFAPLMPRYRHLPVGCVGSEWHRAKASTHPAAKDQPLRMRVLPRLEIA